MVNFEEVKQYVTEQVHAKREPFFNTTSNTARKLQELVQIIAGLEGSKEDGPTEEGYYITEQEEHNEVTAEYVLQLFQFFKKGKGKGKGGKGT